MCAECRSRTDALPDDCLISAGVAVLQGLIKLHFVHSVGSKLYNPSPSAFWYSIWEPKLCCGG